MLTIVPLSFFLVFSIYRLWQEGRKVLIEDIIWGVRVFIVSAVVFFIIRYFLKVNWDSQGLFWYLNLRDYAVWAFLSVFGYYILYGFERKRFFTKAGEVMGFLMGYYILSGVVDCLSLFGNYNTYTLFMLPLFRLSFIFLFSMILGLSGKLNIQLQLLIALGALGFSLLGGTAGMLYYTRHLIGAWVVSGVTAAGAVTSLIFILRSNR